MRIMFMRISFHHPLLDSHTETKQLTTPAVIDPDQLGNPIFINVIPTTIPADTDITPLSKSFISFPPS